MKTQSRPRPVVVEESTSQASLAAGAREIAAEVRLVGKELSLMWGAHRSGELSIDEFDTFVREIRGRSSDQGDAIEQHCAES